MSPASMRNPTVVFRGAGVVEFEDRPLPTPGRGEVLLRTRRTLISPGTELTILSGDFAPGSAWDSYGRFPFVAGYSAAAEVAGLGEGVEGLALGDLVAAGTPHARWSTAPVSGVYPLRGAAVPIDLMPFVTLAATVMNGVRRGQVAWGDSAVVFGLGLLGQLAVRYCRLCGARPVLGVDLIDARIALLPPGVAGVHPERQALRDVVSDATRGRMADVVFEATGDSQLIPASSRCCAGSRAASSCSRAREARPRSSTSTTSPTRRATPSSAPTSAHIPPSRRRRHPGRSPATPSCSSTW